MRSEKSAISEALRDGTLNIEIKKLHEDGILGEGALIKIINESHKHQLLCRSLDVISFTLDQARQKSDAIVCLSIGGKSVDFSKDVLVSDESFIASCLSGRWDALFCKDNDGRVYLEFDFEWVKPLLDSLRTKASSNIPNVNPLSAAATSYFEVPSRPLSWMEDADLKYLSSLMPQYRCSRLLFRASRDGFGANAFHTKCDDIPHLLVIVKTGNGSNLFGGYTGAMCFPRNADGYVKYVGGVQPFLFTIRWRGNKRHSQDIVYGNIETMLYARPSNGPTFGGGHDLLIGDNCNVNQSSSINRGHTYYNNNGSTGNFLVDDYEVYEMVPSGPSGQSQPFQFQFDKLDLYLQQPPDLSLTPLKPYLALSEPLLPLHRAFAVIEQLDRDTCSSYEKLLDKYKSLVLEIDFVARHFGISTGREVTGASRPVDILDNTIELYELLKAAGEQRKGSLHGAELMTINCSGTVLTIKKQTVLDHVPETSLLYSMASDKFAHQLDKKGNVFLNEDAEVVEPILNYLRGKELLRRNKTPYEPRIFVKECHKAALDRVLTLFGMTGIPISMMVVTVTVK